MDLERDEAEVEDDVDVEVVPEELGLEVAAVEVAARVAMVAPRPRNAVTLSAAANRRERAAACRRLAFRGGAVRGWRTPGPRPPWLSDDGLVSTEISFRLCSLMD
jgi:hypothetical protein